MQWRVEVHHINVGQGDSTLILLYSFDDTVKSTSTGGTLEKAILVDAGKSESGRARVLPYLDNVIGKKDKTKTLDAVVVTHYDNDHVGGFFKSGGTGLFQDENFINKYLNNTALYDQGDAGCPYKDTVKAIDKVKRLTTSSSLPSPKKSSGGDEGNRLLGQELFWHDSSTDLLVAPSDPDNVQMDLKDLRNAMQDGNRNKPALFCIGVNQHILKPKSAKTAVDLFPGEAITAPNLRSIALVIVSPENEILYYLAGDLGGAAEDKVVTWLQGSGQGYVVDGTKKIPAMKISHHGAVNATPKDLLRSFKPDYAIISAGKNLTFKHPRIELLLYIYYLNMSNQGRLVSDVLRNDLATIVATNAPYYLDPKYKSDMSGIRSGNSIEFTKLENLLKSSPEEDRLKRVDAIALKKIETDAALPEASTLYADMSQIWKNGLNGQPSLDDDPERIFGTDFGLGYIQAQKVSLGIDSTGFCKKNGDDFVVDLNTVLFERQPTIARKRKGTNSESEKKKIKTSSLFFFKINANTFTIASSSAKGDILLVQDSEFDKFVSLLPDNQLVIDANPSQQGATWSIQGSLGGSVGNWFAALNFNQPQITITGSLDASKNLNVQYKDVKWILEIDKNVLNSESDLTFDGVFQQSADNTVVFSLSSASQAVSVSALDNASFVGYISTEESSVFENLLNIISPSGLSSVLDNTTQIVFNPQGFGTQISLVNALARLDLKFLKFDNLLLSFPTTNRMLNESYISCQSSFTFSAQGTIGGSSNFIDIGDVFVSLEKSGSGTFSFEAGTGLTLDALSQSLFPGNTLSTSLQNLGININLLKQAIIRFELNPKPSLTSVELVTEIDLLKDYKLDTHISWPAGYLSGNLTPDMVEPSSVSPEDQDETTPQISKIEFSGFAKKHSVSIPDKELASWKLANLSFSASSSSGYYSFSVDLNNGSNGLWHFTDQIALTDLAFGLTKSQTDLTANLGASLQLGSTAVVVQADYQKIGATSVWNFYANISHISFSDITNLFIQEVASGTSITFPTINLDNISLAFDSARTFQFSGELWFDSVMFAVDADSSKNGKLISAKWQSTDTASLSLTQLVSLMDIKLPIPADLDLNFTSAQLDYLMIDDSATQNQNSRLFVFQVSLQLDDKPLNGQLMLFSLNKTDFKYLFNLKYDFPKTITGIPVVNEVSLPLQTLEFLFSSSALAKEDLTAVNVLISQIGSSSLVQIDRATINAGANLSIQLDPSIQKDPIEWSLSTPAQNMVLLAATDPTASSIKWIDVQKTFGPIELRRLGINYDTKLRFSLDATVLLGGLKINVQGLSVGFNLSALNKVEFSLSGLGLDYTVGSLEMGGSFNKGVPKPPDEVEHYEGSIVLKTPVFSIAAIGAYSKIHQQAANADFISLFIFGRTESNEPFGGPPYLYVTNFAGGFGYNQRIRFPNQDEVVRFPLVAGASNPSILGGAGADLGTVLTKLETPDSGEAAWIVPIQSQEWLAFGIDFTSFELVQSKALLLVNVGAEFSIGLVGRSWMQLPMAPAPGLAYVEMGLEVLLKPEEGFFGMTAVLSPNSYVLDKNCHLTGGFAFYVWFGGEHAGDFVVTLGGYHPNFPKKNYSWYPDEPRLGFNWRVSDSINISGESYFALTPSCVMAGSKLDAEYHSGDLRAWFKAYADFLIDWAPFHYEAGIGIDVGASYRLNLLFTTVNLEVDLNANLALWGPPLGGEAHINWTIISFTIGFGAGRQPTPAIGWNEFKQQLPTQKDNAKVQANKITAQSGLVRTNNGAWIIRLDQFAFQTESIIPVNGITFNGKAPDGNNDVPTVLNIKPMGKKAIQSTHTVSINTPGGNSWTITSLKRNVPEALWGVPTGATPTPEAKTLPNCSVGLTVTAPASAIGATAGPINIKDAFEDVDTQKSGILPLTESPVVDTSVQSATDIIKQIQNTLVTTDPSAPQKVIPNKQCTLLFNYLKGQSYFLATDTLDPLERFTNQIQQQLTEKPLLRAKFG